MNCVELFDICSSESPCLLEKTLLGLVEGTISPKKQCEEGVCFADKLQKEECLINWGKTAKQIHNLVRGVYKCPSAHFIYNGKIVKVLQTELLDDDLGGEVGEFVRYTRQGVDVKTAEGLIRLVKVKPEGKGEMFAADWANGLNKKV